MTSPQTFTHRHTVWPSLGGHGTGLVARIGDWTWQAVARDTGSDVLKAYTEDGRPAYLSFHYYRVRGSADFHLRTPTFGDQLTVGTQVHRSGSQSMLTLHRILLDPTGDAAATIDPDTFWDAVGPGELRAEQINRWISHTGTSNENLEGSAPAGFRVDRLAPTPEQAPSRRRVLIARRSGSFRPEGLTQVGPTLTLDYEVDPARDLNAVGLLYFAAYFGIIDWAVGRAWSAWGRDVPTFLNRVIEDIELLYEGNADPAARLQVDVTRWQGEENVEYIDVTLRQPGRVVAVSTQRLLTAPPGAAAAPPDPGATSPVQDPPPVAAGNPSPATS